MLPIIKITGTCLSAFTLLYLLAIMPRMMHRPDTTPFKNHYYAHRGLHDNASPAPENSMTAFALAVQSGFGIELDVQLTRDEVPVVFHDTSLKRVCGVDKRLSDLTFSELQECRLYDSNETIPRFTDVLALVNGQVPLIVELKFDGWNPRLCELADRLLSAYEGVYCVESFYPQAVFWYRKNRPHIVRGQLADHHSQTTLIAWVLQMLLFNRVTKPDFIAYNCKFRHSLSRILCRKLYGNMAVAWTIQSEEELKQCRQDFDLFIFEGFIPKED